MIIPCRSYGARNNLDLYLYMGFTDENNSTDNYPLTMPLPKQTERLHLLHRWGFPLTEFTIRVGPEWRESRQVLNALFALNAPIESVQTCLDGNEDMDSTDLAEMIRWLRVKFLVLLRYVRLLSMFAPSQPAPSQPFRMLERMDPQVTPKTTRLQTILQYRNSEKRLIQRILSSLDQ